MSAPHAVPGSFASAPYDEQAATLVDGLRSEEALLGDLQKALLRQREAVATEDIEGVEDAVRDVQRILLTLGEALARRRAYLEIMTGSSDTELGTLGKAPGHAHAGLEETAGRLLGMAREVSSELQTTRTLLRGAIATGDHYLKTMTGAEDTESLYRPAEDSRSHRQKALLVDRQV